MTGLVPKSDFIALEGKISLVGGGEPPLLKRHRDAFEQYANDKSLGYAGYWHHWTLWHASPHLIFWLKLILLQRFSSELSRGLNNKDRSPMPDI